MYFGVKSIFYGIPDHHEKFNDTGTIVGFIKCPHRPKIKFDDGTVLNTYRRKKIFSYNKHYFKKEI
jgi:hypothetical protein